jgi:hypothetical protein
MIITKLMIGVNTSSERKYAPKGPSNFVKKDRSNPASWVDEDCANHD